MTKRDRDRPRHGGLEYDFYMDMLDVCPCCGNNVGEGEYEGCPICYWYDVYGHRRFPDSAGANGRITLRMGQENVRSFGMYERREEWMKWSQGPDPQPARDPRWRPVRELDAAGFTRDGAFSVRCDFYAELGSTCPCCGQSGALDICERCGVCGWRTTEAERLFPYAIGANGTTLFSAQEAFVHEGVFAPLVRDSVCAEFGQPHRAADPNWNRLTVLKRILITMTRSSD